MNHPDTPSESETLTHLFRSLGNLYAPGERLVYVNRDIDFNHIKVVGFDLDYTLARYRQAELEQLTLEPYERDHAVVVAAYRVAKKKSS